MEKQTKILIGAGALALAYYLYNARKASAPVSPNGATLPPISTTPNAQALESLKQAAARLQLQYPLGRPIGDIQPNKPFQKTKDCETTIYDCYGPFRKEIIQIPIEDECYKYQNAKPQCAEPIFDDKLAWKIAAGKAEADRLANEQAEAKRIEEEQLKRLKAMNDFMYPTCPDGFEFYQNNCMPTYIIVEEKAKIGEGLVLRDFKNNTTTLVQTCPAEYVKQGINCIPRYSLSPQQLQVVAMQEAGMVQTSDGQWYTNSVDAAIAQSRIDANTSAQGRGYTARQSAINDAICSIDRDGYINNPNSTTNGMSLKQYIGEYKVTANELAIARFSCPNSVYSSNLIAGGRADDETLGYK